MYRKNNYTVHASNLCTEIMLPSNEDWSFVCCLSSINVLHYEKWKDTDAVETMIYFLDAVISEFVEKLDVYKNSADLDDQQTFLFMKRAYSFAKEHRALGLGVLGWHSLLQSKMFAFNSQEAYNLNTEIFKLIKIKSYAASEKLAQMFGEPKVLKGIGNYLSNDKQFFQPSVESQPPSRILRRIPENRPRSITRSRRASRGGSSIPRGNLY